MNIVDRQTFLLLPAGTVYAKGTDAQAGGLGAVCIKGETVGTDWYEQRLIGEFTEVDSEESRIEAMVAMRRGESRTLDFETPRRDGLFKADQLFAATRVRGAAKIDAIRKHDIEAQAAVSSG
ncbi:hypothetical protein [Altererythrobacter sp. C41]|uniref:hypothetical protein n=1 Tax=Altererythrobacter sp. C41 TaxID=2806021 RepID=UPI001931A282|nr:hypothetical protein [Altererythrobacter sp. C41]MBM0169673.1 hypothetical protein [Altererythrobacter sp. C41]